MVTWSVTGSMMDDDDVSLIESDVCVCVYACNFCIIVSFIRNVTSQIDKI